MSLEIVATLGEAGSGKSTLVNLLRDRFVAAGDNVVVHHYAFAGPLKRGCQHFFGLSDEQLYTDVGKETVDPRYGVTPRRILQAVGTNLIRDALPKFVPGAKSLWVGRFREFADGVVRQAQRDEQRRHVLFIDDLRFPDEATAIADVDEAAVTFARVVRPPTEDEVETQVEYDSNVTGHIGRAMLSEPLHLWVALFVALWALVLGGGSLGAVFLGLAIILGAIAITPWVKKQPSAVHPSEAVDVLVAHIQDKLHRPVLHVFNSGTREELLAAYDSVALEGCGDAADGEEEDTSQ